MKHSSPNPPATASPVGTASVYLRALTFRPPA
jgi:hypothetical protein